MCASRLRVLVVEDEPLVAMDIESMLREVGCDPVATAGNLGEATHMAKVADVDAALLDIFIEAAPRYEIADILSDRLIPFLFTSGTAASDLPERFRHLRFLNKPFSTGELGAALEAATQLRERSSTDA